MQRPKITLENTYDYLDWIASQELPREAMERHMQLAALAVRLRMGEAQDKATQHTLVEDGVIKPPPQAS